MHCLQCNCTDYADSTGCRILKDNSCCAVLCCPVLCCVVCYAMLCCAVSSHHCHHHHHHHHYYCYYYDDDDDDAMHGSQKFEALHACCRQLQDDVSPAIDKTGTLSTHERQQQRMQERIAKLEAQNMAEKDWFMSGEAGAGILVLPLPYSNHAACCEHLQASCYMQAWLRVHHTP